MTLFSLGTFEKEIIEQIKNAKYYDLEEIAYRMQLTYDEIVDIHDVNYIATSSTGLYNQAFMKLVILFCC